MGLLAGLNASSILEGKQLQPPPVTTALGSLLNYITSSEHADNFQPMNINFGLLEPLPGRKIKKKERNRLYVDRSLQALQEWIINWKMELS
ncbi:MAG: FADH(2)-oxidizing methylenetetrahydrofolate--tRNA-(uracil(54)-C(5))-methyltransferase TrmFO, partial [Deltaproteobacteria bacterium HGW-Deltaproteobacteria-10]